MIFVRVIDEDGFFIEDSFVEELTDLTIETPCPSGFYHPKWDGDKWIEGLTQEEIDSIKSNSIQAPTDQERLEALENLLTELILKGGV